VVLVDQLADVVAQRIALGNIQATDGVCARTEDFCHVAFLASGVEKAAGHYVQRWRTRSNIDLRFAFSIRPRCARYDLLMRNRPYEASACALI
jgi:hypothetical protein